MESKNSSFAYLKCFSAATASSVTVKVLAHNLYLRTALLDHNLAEKLYFAAKRRVYSVECFLTTHLAMNESFQIPLRINIRLLNAQKWKLNNQITRMKTLAICRIRKASTRVPSMHRYEYSPQHSVRRDLTLL